MMLMLLRVLICNSFFGFIGGAVGAKKYVLNLYVL